LEQERRSLSRSQLELAITFDIGWQASAAVTANLSEGGLFIATTELKPIGTEIDLTMTLPHPLPAVWARGEVRWIGEASSDAGAPLGMGVQFRMISEESLRTIREFLWKNSHASS
jgi:uncharacterized protein (TIGR02266 family)